MKKFIDNIFLNIATKLNEQYTKVSKQKNKTLGGASSVDTFDDDITTIAAINKLKDFSDYYKLIPQVYSVAKSVKEIKDTCIAQKWVIYDKVSEDEVEPANQSPELKEFLKNPSISDCWDDLLTLFIIDYLIAGNIYAYFVINEGRLVIQRFNPSDIEIEGTNLGYEYFLNNNNNRIPLNKKYLIHIKNSPNPNNPLIGVGVIEENLEMFKHIIDVLAFRYYFFKNGCNPSGVFSTDNPEGGLIQDDRLQKLIDTKYIGSKKAGVPLILPEKLTFHQIGLDTARLNISDELSGEHIEIMSAFGLPRFLMELGIKSIGQKYNNHEKQLQHYLLNTIIPVLKKITIIFNEGVSKFNPRFGFKFLVPIEIFTPEIIDKLVERGIFTPNEGRKLLGMPLSENPAMDKHYTQSGRVELGAKEPTQAPPVPAIPPPEPEKKPPLPAAPVKKIYINNGIARIKSWRDTVAGGWVSIPENLIWSTDELLNEKNKSKIRDDFLRLGKATIDRKGKGQAKNFAEYLAEIYVGILKKLNDNKVEWEAESKNNRKKLTSKPWESVLFDSKGADLAVIPVMDAAHIAVGEAAYSNIGEVLTAEIPFGSIGRPEVAAKIKLLRINGPRLTKTTNDKLAIVLKNSMSLILGFIPIKNNGIQL